MKLCLGHQIPPLFFHPSLPWKTNQRAWLVDSISSVSWGHSHTKFEDKQTSLLYAQYIKIYLESGHQIFAYRSNLLHTPVVAWKFVVSMIHPQPQIAMFCWIHLYICVRVVWLELSTLHEVMETSTTIVSAWSKDSQNTIE